MIARARQCLNRVGDRRSARSNRQSGGAALQSCHAFLQHRLGGVGQPAIDVAALGKSEPGSRLCAVRKYVRGRLINRYRTGIGGAVRLFLADVQL